MGEPVTAAAIGQVVEDVLRPGNFFVAPGASLDWQPGVVEELPWEVFQGRLLDAGQTRLRRSFLSWNLYWTDDSGRSGEPILSVKLDDAGRLHVVRGLHLHVWEGYDAGDNVILSRETTRWVRELVGTVEPERLSDPEALRRELAVLVLQAVVGVSRLPLTSVESPLPAFSFGQLAYCYRTGAGAQPMRTAAELLRQGLSAAAPRGEQARLLEAALRTPPAAGFSAELFLERWLELGQPAEGTPGLLRVLFNEVSLSPWTGLVDNALAFLRQLVDRGALARAAEVDFLGHLLRQLGRHLAAYDLVTFHHRGANYPDALLLDAVLKRFLELAERHTELFLPAAEDGEERLRDKRLRRRGLRQGWLLRRRYEAHPVPDEPTSPGENARVLPGRPARVPEEQILQPNRRSKRLFRNEPLEPHLGAAAREVLLRSVQDLRHPAELRELGTAVFIDRPLGVFKSPAEPDRTVLLSQEAFSRFVAEGRLAVLAREPDLLPDAEARQHRQTLREGPAPRGLPLSAVQCEERRVVSLADVRRAGDDFLLLRTTRQTVADFLGQYDLAPLAARFPLDFLGGREPVLLVPEPCAAGAAERVLAVYDARMRRRLQLGFTRAQGYELRGGREFPTGGLQVLRLWEEDRDQLREHELGGTDLWLRPVP